MWFLDHGALPSSYCNGRGYSALDAAASFASPDIVMVLLDHGAMVSNTNALHMAVRSTSRSRRSRRDMVEFLLDAGVDIDAIEHAGNWPFSPNYGTALHVAASCGHEDLVRLLLERGADTSIQNLSYRTACEAAKMAGHSRIVMLLSGTF